MTTPAMSKTTLRACIYVLIAVLSTLNDGIEHGLTLRLVFSAAIAGLLTLRAFVDQTAAREETAATTPAAKPIST